MKELTLGLTLREIGLRIRGKIVDLVCGTDISCSDYVVCESSNTVVEDEAFDIKIGSFGNDNGYGFLLGMGSLPKRVEIDGHFLEALYVNHTDRLIFMEFEGSTGGVFAASSVKITLGGTGQEVELQWDSGLKLYVVESISAMNYFNVNDDVLLGFMIHKPVVSQNTVPKVSGSTIFGNNDKRIVVEWDKEMKGSTDIRFAIDIIIDGTPAVLPETVIFENVGGKFYMMLVMTLPLTASNVITWSYDDSTTYERLSSVVGDIEADNQTYAVDNKLATNPPPPADDES